MSGLPHNTQVRITSEGRSGVIHFENPQSTFSMWWEFAGAGALAIINIPSVAQWESTTKLPLSQREDVLRIIGEHVVRTQTSGRGRYDVDEQFITVYADTTV
ncbi:hypothetical protein [Gemmatimonas phototrophica]|uniref:hypothetical protein n=1 Tax=Gemmatimonas phototrophica TaxID=1379270 RepID=UPI00047D3257|nr:hypothetical protein [Gemmatimonas phototrophica]